MRESMVVNLRIRSYFVFIIGKTVVLKIMCSIYDMQLWGVSKDQRIIWKFEKDR